MWRLSKLNVLQGLRSLQRASSVWVPKTSEMLVPVGTRGAKKGDVKDYEVCQDEKDKKGGKDNKGKSAKCPPRNEQKNRAVVLHGILDMRIEVRSKPKPGPDDVLVAMDCCGICGSDVHFYETGHLGHYTLDKPMVTGHEAAGVIIETGKNVKHLKKNDRVTIEPGIPCYKCAYCKMGRYNLCPGTLFFTTALDDGCLADFCKFPADWVYKIPDHLSMEEGALIEPLAVAVGACRRARVRGGDQALVMGSGPVGLCVLMVLARLGAENICITDTRPDRLQLAQELGATSTQLILPDMSPACVAQEVTKTMSMQPGVVIDCFGSAATVNASILAARPGGRVCLVGLAEEKAEIPISRCLTQEIDIVGNWRYCNDYPAALGMAASGALQLKRLVTHHFDLCQSEEAFNVVKDSKDGAIKVMIHIQKRDKNNKTPFEEKGKEKGKGKGKGKGKEKGKGKGKDKGKGKKKGKGKGKKEC